MPSPRSDEGSTELRAAARLRGKPLLRLNNLTRWYVRTAFVFLLLPGLVPLIQLGGIFVPDGAAVPWLIGGMLLFAGGLSLKFLPSSLGANPQVYSARLALWSYWFLVVGTPVWGGGTLLTAGRGWAVRTASSAGGLAVLTGGVCLLYNVWKSTGERV